MDMTDMKRYALFMLLMAAAAVVACKKNSDIEEKAIEEQPSVGSYIYTVKASIPKTKSDYDVDGKFSWSEGDAISVLFHNGSDNQFFTLTRVSGTGNSATFSGEITDGYTIGASDGTVSDKKIWVLFPANDHHAYTEGSAPSFFMEPETDFTAAGAHWSANMPLYDLLVDEGDVSFKNLCSGFRFTFTNINATVNKVMITIDNNAATYKLSGDLPLVLDSGEYCIKPDWGDAGAERILSYVANVDKVNNNVVVYVPTRRNTTYFQPVVDLIDYETGNTITHSVATSQKASPVKGKIKRITIDTENSTGTPWSFTSMFGIDWSGIASAAGETSDPSHSGVSLMKATSDASYIYLYVEVDKRKLLTDSSRDYANAIYTYFGDNTSAAIDWPWNGKSGWNDRKTAWLTKYGQPSVSSWESIIATTGANVGTAIRRGDYFCYDMKLTRSANAILQNTGVLYMGACIYNTYYNGGSRPDQYLVVPALGEAMYSLTITDAYVAP